MTLEELWNAALGELELELSKPKFVTWFSNTFILEQEGDGVVIGVPNAFTKSYLEKQYHGSITQAVKRISDDTILRVGYKVAAHKPEQPASAPVEPTKPERTGPPSAMRASQRAAAPRVPKQQAMHTNSIGLNESYTFENFVVGKKNELAHAACIAASEQPGQAYNPLFMYGGVGLGKTHLMQAVGHAILERIPETKILYVTCETFTNEFIKMVGEGRADEFKNKYRSVDVLMVDDVQFLAGKEGTQEAFFHTFNHLYQQNKQILLTSDRAPRAIPTLEDRLVSRFEGGMIVDVSLPDLETRIAILGQKCRQKGYHLSSEITQYIASNVQNNIRELEGALNRVIAFHQLNKTEPTIASVQQLLSSFHSTPKRGAITAKKILGCIVDFFDISQEALVGNSRKKELVVPRQIAMYLMRNEMHASYPNIGQELGGRDHTTAMHACQNIEKLLEDDEKIKNDVNMVKQRLYNS